jgi:hypothetical protein
MGNGASLSIEDCTCQLCHKILLKPILVPCKCKSNICQEHLNRINVSNNVAETFFFECEKCKTKLNLLKEDLKENSQLNRDLEHHNYLSNKIKKLKLRFEEKLTETEKYVENLNEVNIAEYSDKIYEHFYSLRNEIDIKRETVLEQLYKNDGVKNNDKIEAIQSQSSNLIEQIDLTEKEFRKKFMQEITSFINEIDIDEKRESLYEMLRNTSLSAKDMENKINECETKMKQIQSDLAQIEQILAARLRANKFKEFNQSVVQGETNKSNIYLIC